MRFNSPEFGPDSTLFPDPPDYEELKKIRIWRILVLLVVVAILSMLILGAYEFRTSAIQATEAERLAARLTYELQPGKSTQIQYPVQGPFDRRLGYSRLPEFLARLQPEWSTSRQVSMSDALVEYINLGFYPPYKEKDQVGLTVLDCRGEAFYQFNYPGEHYADFAQVPPLVWKALLFIEDRNLFSNEYPTENPAINWLRLSKAAFYRVVSLLGISVPSMGGSTLATQIEKYRHSSDGLTSSVTEKLQQLVSATVRIYQQGGDTSEERRRLVLSYLNTVPLAAAPRHGEVHGVLDGLRVWFAADPGQVNRILRSHPSSPAQLAEQGLALKQVLALMIAHRRPSWYLLNGRDELDDLVASYVRLMFKAGEISRELQDAALQQQILFRDFNRTPIQVTADISKAQTLIRNKVASALDVSLYDLDRLDLSVASALHAGLQYQVTDYLKGLNQKENAQEAGLFGHRLLKPGQAEDLQYSFTLFERTAAGNRVRVQTDNTDQPFDINEGSKLELGSTAKLRVLATYLEIVAELHTRITEQDKPLILNQDSDPLTRWAVEYLAQAEHRDLENMLSAAMTRSYSANPRQHFFTGGGEHIFSNFLARDNSRSPTVIESLRESINLPFVRMLQDIIKYIINENLDKNAQLLGDDKDPRRLEYLERFADREGSVFLRRFWHKYNRDQKQPEQMETLLSSFRQTENTLAAVHRTVLPDARL
ncbi:MAG: transglycosylase domain-containing protein, partial [Pseudomonadales bacterium]|nr:transglycosylase domain-containing protein [Pseudomonadales bacterium]